MISYHADTGIWDDIHQRFAVLVIESLQAKIILNSEYFGLQNLNKQMKLALLQIMEDRYAKKSIIITAQLPVSEWHEYLSEPAIADALCDRLTAKSQGIELKGPSMRRGK